MPTCPICGRELYSVADELTVPLTDASLPETVKHEPWFDATADTFCLTCHRCFKAANIPIDGDIN